MLLSRIEAWNAVTMSVNSSDAGSTSNNTPSASLVSLFRTPSQTLDSDVRVEAAPVTAGPVLDPTPGRGADAPNPNPGACFSAAPALDPAPDCANAGPPNPNAGAEAPKPPTPDPRAPPAAGPALDPSKGRVEATAAPVPGVLPDADPKLDTPSAGGAAVPHKNAGDFFTVVRRALAGDSFTVDRRALVRRVRDAPLDAPLVERGAAAANPRTPPTAFPELDPLADCAEVVPNPNEGAAGALEPDPPPGSA
eukprot:3695127-Rhodomonas_salina.2